MLHGMASVEPFTLRALGSPQVFQTGETFKSAPLIDYQHPHDLIMGLGATYRIESGAVAYSFGADAVGSPALGPTAFMHRESGRNNPSSTALASLSRLHPYHPGRPARRRRG